MSENPSSSFKPILVAATKSLAFLYLLREAVIYSYVIHLSIISPPPPRVIEVIETYDPPPVVVTAEPEVITETVVKTVTRVRDELTQEQLRRIRREEEEEATLSSLENRIVVPRSVDDDDDNDEDEDPLIYHSTRHDLNAHVAEYRSLAESLRLQIQTLRSNLTSRSELLAAHRQTLHTPITTPITTEEDQRFLTPAEIQSAAHKDVRAFLSSHDSAVPSVKSGHYTTLLSSLIKDYRDGRTTAGRAGRDLDVYLAAVAESSRGVLEEVWGRLASAYDAAVAERKRGVVEEEAGAKAKKATGGERTATKEDLEEYTASVLESVREHLGRYYTVLLLATDEGAGVMEAFHDDVVEYRDGEYAAVLEQVEERRVDVVRRLEERYRENEEVSAGDGEGKCVTEDEVRYLVDGGIRALLGKEDLSWKVADMVTGLVVGEEEDRDSKEFRRSFSSVDNELRVMVEDGAVADGDEDDDRKGGGGGETDARSSFAHADTLRTVVLDNPLFPKVLRGIDSAVEKVEGYSDVLDRAIDYVVGDEEDGRTLGSTVGDVVTEVLGSVALPREFREMKEKAGILHFNQV